MSNTSYEPIDFGEKEKKRMNKFMIRLQDSKDYFLSCIKPRLDTSYKLYIASNLDRGKEIKSWQSNVSVPYVQAVVETLMPRILDARPDFTVQGRTEDDQNKSEKLEEITDYTWELAQMDVVNEDVVRSSLVYGMGYMQASWKQDIRDVKFLKTKNIGKKKYEWVKKKKAFYDAPTAEWVDNYDLWYDWHNIPAASKQYWFKRKILTGEEIKRRYPMYDKKRLKLAFLSGSGNLTDYASIRNEVKTFNNSITKNSISQNSGGYNLDRYNSADLDDDVKMYEIFEWWSPFEDLYSVHVGGSYVPILKGGFMPNPYNFKEAPFISFPYLKIPGEFEGYGLSIILEQPQIMLNMIKNQRLDAMTLNIHKMWIVNPLANINKSQLVTRPFGIIYSNDPNGVREVQFSDVKASAYREEELLKGDMRYASGVDDFSMGAGGSASSATEVRHLRESTLERVRLYINHLGNGYSKLMRFWISMYGQFFTEKMTIRVTGEDGRAIFPLVEKDDLMGFFDYKASVLPSIAGKMDIEKKQNMDLYQLLINMPFIDPRKLTNKILHSWNWNIDSISKEENATHGNLLEGLMGGGQPPEGGVQPPEGAGTAQPMGGSASSALNQQGGGVVNSGDLSPEKIQQALNLLAGNANVQPTGGGVASAVNNGVQMPQVNAGNPNAGKIPAGTAPRLKENVRGMNRGGKVNTNVNSNDRGDAESRLMGQAVNLQR